MTVGFKTFVPKQCPTVFRVQNIAPDDKRIKIFNLPINNGEICDLMAIPEVSEADIRHSLLKGTLNLKARAHEIIVVESTIDLLQFDECHKSFLESIGIDFGLDVDGAGYTASQEGEVLYSKDGETFTASLSLTSDQGWLVNDQGLLLLVY